MVTALILGAGIAGAAIAGRVAINVYARASAGAGLKAGGASGGFLSAFRSGSKYYKGGFEQKMSRREAGLILGVRENVPKQQVKDAHRRIMLANHPDRGGSPYIAAKINEAKQMLDK